MDLQELVHEYLIKILCWKYLGKQTCQEELQLFFVLGWSGKHQKWLLLWSYLYVIRIWCLQIVYLRLTKDKGFCFYCPLFECYSSSHVLYMLHYEIHWHSVVSKTRDYYVSIYYWRKDEISKSIFHKFVVLLQYTYYWSSSLGSISLQSST